MKSFLLILFFIFICQAQPGKTYLDSLKFEAVTQLSKVPEQYIGNFLTCDSKLFCQISNNSIQNIPILALYRASKYEDKDWHQYIIFVLQDNEFLFVRLVKIEEQQCGRFWVLFKTSSGSIDAYGNIKESL